MSDIQLFKSDEFGELRTFSDGGDVWFVAKDVCSILGLGRQQDSTRYLDEDEKGVCLVDTPSGEQQMTTVTEAGFYRLVLKSRKPEAKAFKRWVTHDVLPALRRDGAYVASDGSESDEQLMARALLAASDGTCLVGELAKMLRQNGVPVGQNRLFATLREDGYLGKSGSNRNVPTRRSMELDLFRIKETAITHSDGHVSINRTPKVTGKGQSYFLERYGGPILGEGVA